MEVSWKPLEPSAFSQAAYQKKETLSAPNQLSPLFTFFFLFMQLILIFKLSLKKIFLTTYFFPQVHFLFFWKKPLKNCKVTYVSKYATLHYISLTPLSLSLSLMCDAFAEKIKISQVKPTVLLLQDSQLLSSQLTSLT